MKPRHVVTWEVVTMRYLPLTALLVLGLAGTGVAAASGTLPYHIAVSGTAYAGTTPSGTMSGTLGGLPVIGSYADGNWNLTAFGRPFASGTYECIRTCAFAGRSLAGRSMIFMLSSPVPTADAPTVVANGRLWLSAIRQKGAWISTVSQWTQRSHLTRAESRQAIADAMHI
jgi:hypothetical protein